MTPSGFRLSIVHQQRSKIRPHALISKLKNWIDLTIEPLLFGQQTPERMPCTSCYLEIDFWESLRAPPTWQQGPYEDIEPTPWNSTIEPFIIIKEIPTKSRISSNSVESLASSSRVEASSHSVDYEVASNSIKTQKTYNRRIFQTGYVLTIVEAGQLYERVVYMRRYLWLSGRGDRCLGHRFRGYGAQLVSTNFSRESGWIRKARDASWFMTTIESRASATEILRPRGARLITMPWGQGKNWRDLLWLQYENFE